MRRTLLPALCLAVLVAGCGPGKARVKGRVTEGGQPASFPPTAAAIQIAPIGSDGEPDPARAFTAVVNEDGTWEVLASGGELPTGEYEIAFQATGKLKGKFQSKPVRQQLKAGTNEVTIDVTKVGA